jgi:uracil-DNA glycosylase
MTTQDTLTQIAKEVSVCTDCALHKTRNLSVPGEGPSNAEIMLIGEGPGANEDAQGRPFVGQAGKFLEDLLAQAGLKRTDVWICNVVKCRPPLNRDPQPEELSACSLYLERQIEAINPKIIITLGRFSMARFMPGVTISRVHGQMRRDGDRFVIAMFHPAAALHQAALKPTILSDFARLPQLLEVARKEIAKSASLASLADKTQVGSNPQSVSHQPEPDAEPEQPKQMKLF